MMSDRPPFHPVVANGQAGRVSFFDEQARRRRQAKVWAGVTIAVAGLLGWVLGFLAVAAILFYSMLLSTVLPRSLAKEMQRLAPNSDAVFWPLVVGGLLFAGALWVTVWLVFGRDTSAAFLGRLQARAPNLADPEEKQLVNVVEEMAIAAAAPMPQVKLFDGDAINAATLGADARTATLLISRRLLDTLDRDETQGVVGHLTSSAINGDLTLTAEMLRTFHVLGLAVTMLDFPFSRRARSTLGEMLGLVFRSRSTQTEVARELVAGKLTESLQPEGMDALNTFMRRALEPENKSELRRLVGALLLMPLLPLIMMRIAAALLYGMLSLFVLGPLVALLLRSRRRLADATAVQLTRNPDGLACALVRLVQEAHTVPNAGWSEMLFIVGEEAASVRRMEKLQRSLRVIHEKDGDWKERAQAVRAMTGDADRETETEAKKHNFIFDFHPSISSRIDRLKKMGATKVQWEHRKDYSGWLLASVVTFVFGIVVLIAIAGSRGK